MHLLLLLAAQTAAPATPPPTAWQPRVGIDFDLADVRSGDGPAAGCTRDGSEEVLVCGRRAPGTGDYPLDEMALVFAQRPIRAETGLSGSLSGRIHLEQVEVQPGVVSNRVMIGVRLPF